jgi:phage-related tail fiber protein
MSFVCILTAVGLAKITAANVPGGPALSLTQIAVGDGSGNPTTPDAGQTALVHEVYRDQINSVFVNPSDNTILMAEFLIPSAIGGWGIREIGVFDATGALIAVGNFPDTYKPIAAEGSTRDMAIYVAIKVGNSANVQLVIDTSIVLATRPWVLATITAGYLLPGGLTGQILKKLSNASGDVGWGNLTDAVTIAVNAIKEIQTATAAQQIFTLATMTTVGAAVYVEGAREFDYTLLNATQIQLSRTLPAGTRVMFVQNEPNEPLQIRKTITGRGYFIGQLA